ncbi:MAG: type II toxin-antitoxin system prevent-host-death family antitoxin [Candidatus Competibacteraceae bacterium]
MSTVTLQEAQAQLPHLIHRLNPGDEMVIIENDQPVAKLVRSELKQQWPCKAGSAKNTLHWMAPDFDAPLDEFKDYME